MKDYYNNNNEKLVVLELLEEIEDMLEEVSAVPFTGKIMLSRGELIDIIGKISAKMPEEYQRVKYLFENKEEILKEAEEEAKNIINAAKEQEAEILNHLENKKEELNVKFAREHDKLVDNNEIVQAAKRKAEAIINDAKGKAREMRRSSFDYSQKMLQKSKRDLEEKLEILNKNISELERMK